MSDQTYNGWTNYETWAVGLYLDGNYTGEGTYRTVLDITREHGAYVPMVAEALEEYVDGATTEDPAPEGLALDLLRAALSEVNWNELATHKCDEVVEGWTGEARAMGVEAAKNAASWMTDGTSDPEHLRRVLNMLDEGDPQADDYLPRRPNLSGEFADDPTPQSIAEEITGVDGLSDEVIDALSSAFETGVDETFTQACEAELHKALD